MGDISILWWRNGVQRKQQPEPTLGRLINAVAVLIVMFNYQKEKINILHTLHSKDYLLGGDYSCFCYKDNFETVKTNRLYYLSNQRNESQRNLGGYSAHLSPSSVYCVQAHRDRWYIERMFCFFKKLKFDIGLSRRESTFLSNYSWVRKCIWLVCPIYLVFHHSWVLFPFDWILEQD